MSTIIRTRSPFFIRTPQQTSSLLNYFQINITISGGLSTESEPCDDLYAAYELKKKPLAGEDSVSFDISELVNDHIYQVFEGNYSNHSLKASVWVTVASTARQSDGTVIGSITQNTYLAQEGYNLFKEGVNYTTEPKYMLSNNYQEFNYGSYLYIPINKELVTSVVYKNASGSAILTHNYSDNGNQNQKIAYAQINTASYSRGTIKTATVTTSSDTFDIELQEAEECKYPVHKITFLNRWGALQDLFFFKKSVEMLDTTNESFDRSIFKARSVTKEFEEGEGEGEEGGCVETITYNSYSTFQHSKKIHNANGTESITLNSGFKDEKMNVYFEELMVSEYIWLTDESNVIYPVTLKDSNFTYKTGLNDRLINYTMNFEKSFSLVNNIR